MKIFDLKDVIQTPEGEELFPPEEEVVRAYAELRNIDKDYLTPEARMAGGYLTQEGKINYSKFEAELHRIVENQDTTAFVAYKGDKPAGFIIYGPSSYPDNQFEEYVDVNHMPVMVYAMPGNSIQLREMLFSEELSEKEAEQFAIFALDRAFALDGREGLIVEVDRKNMVLFDILHDLGFETTGYRDHEIGKQKLTDRYYPMEFPHYDFKQYRETADVKYAPLGDIVERIASGKFSIHPRAKESVGFQEKLPPPSAVIDVEHLR